MNPQIGKSNLIILGELHGANATIDVIKTLVREYTIRSVVFEFPSEWQQTIATIGVNKEKAKRLLSTVRDGRVLAGHIALIEGLQKKGLSVFAVDEETSWNKNDKAIADKIKQILKKDRNKPCLVILGRLHARKKPFVLEGKRYVPAGSYFDKHTVHIGVRYGSGAIENFGKRTVNDPYVQKVLGSKKVDTVRSRSPYFDYDYMVKETKPGQLIKKSDE